MLKMSVVGVSIAAITKLANTAYFLFLERNAGVSTPIFDNIVMASGISNTRPKARRNFT